MKRLKIIDKHYVNRVFRSVRVFAASSLGIQKSVITALLFRELNSRFGRYRLGYGWAILEPLLFIGTLTLIRISLGSGDVGGVAYPLFFASGILPYLFFQNVVNVSLSAIEANSGVLNYQRVKAFDVIAARWLLEIIIFIFTALLIFTGFKIAGFEVNLPAIGYSVLGTMLLAFFAFGIGMLFAVIAVVWGEIKKIVPVIMRPLFFVSGFFFTVDSLPSEIKDLALLNPLIHSLQLIRYGLLSGYEGRSWDLGYLATWSFATMLLGLSLLRIFREKVLASGTLR